MFGNDDVVPGPLEQHPGLVDVVAHLPADKLHNDRTHLVLLAGLEAGARLRCLGAGP